MDRDGALLVARDRFEAPIWALLRQLEQTLADFAKVQHADLNDFRAIGSVLNSSLPDAAEAAGLSGQELYVAYFENGQSNKVVGTITFAGRDYSASLELHLCGPLGGTSKAAHQFAGYDIEQEPTFPGFELEAPPDLLFFIACHLTGTGVSFAKAYLKFADGIDQRKVELHRDVLIDSAGSARNASTEASAAGPAGSKLTVKKPQRDQERDGSKADKRGNAASSSKKA